MTRKPLAVLLVAVLTLTAGPPATAAAPVPADVNGDGIADLVMATSARLTYSGDTSLLPNDLGGSIEVLPGGTTLPAAFVNQNTPGVQLGMTATDRFGAALATGDLNGDGLADVAIGNPGEAVNGFANAGTVSILYGQRTAPYLRTIPGALGTITQDTADVPGGAEAGDLFGGSLATGDFNGDGYADLAVGAPGEAIGTVARAGAVWVFYGGSAGLTTHGVTAFNQDDPDLAGVPEAGDLMGWALAAGDVTGDKRDDLAVLSAGEVISGVTGATGAVHLLPGSAAGLVVAGSSVVNVGNAATGGKWRSLAIGRFHGGGNADLVVAADNRRGGPAGSGALVVVRGSASGLVASGAQVIDQDTANVPGGTEVNDTFGGSVAVGDLDGDGFDDLAAGSIKEDNRTGSVFLFRGGASGLLGTAPVAFSENNPAINANAQVGEGFGYGLRVLDSTGDGKPELIVTAPWEDGSAQTGALFVLTVGRSGDALAVTQARRITRTEIGTPSNYGPGTPIAGGAHVLNDNQDSPR